MNEIQQQQQYYNMVNTSKMGDLDVNLITLYARTPALYDKRNPFYKDKQYSERAWNDISMKLGYKGKFLIRFRVLAPRTDGRTYVFSGDSQRPDATAPESLQSREAED